MKRTNQNCHFKRIHHRPLAQTVAVLLLSLMLFPAKAFPFGYRTNVFLKPSHDVTRRYLNRFLFDPSEVQTIENDFIPKTAGGAIHHHKVILPKDDYRTIHAAKILRLENGDTIRAGIVSCDDHDGLWTDNAIVEWISPTSNVEHDDNGKSLPQQQQQQQQHGSLSIQLWNLTSPNNNGHDNDDAPMDDIHVSLILAVPRPLQLSRILPMVSQMGIEQLVLTGARKVPKDYFGSQLFRPPGAAMKERLMEGLCQSGDVRLPKVHVSKNLKYFLQDDLDRLFPIQEYARVLAHPQRIHEESVKVIRMGDVIFPTPSSSSMSSLSQSKPKMVIAVGPEGGWEEPEELDIFRERGFQQVTMGTRTLRTDCAVVSLLSLAHEVCHARYHGKTQ